MASHVVVIDTAFRRHQVKVNPGTYLSDVLEEACNKFNLKASNYGFKHNNKPLDMSRTIRQTGLSGGAKLELIVVSRSPSVVSIALQLPETLAGSAPGGRLLDKFASNTTLWHILRAFESKEGCNYNFTGRGVAQVEQGTAGAGRVYYEMPILNIMGRELSSFTDLQKTMGQLGINGGSSLIRMSFRKTDTPLEDAMAEIGQYFKKDDTQSPENTAGPIGESKNVSSDAALANDIPSEPADEHVMMDFEEVSAVGAPSALQLASDSPANDNKIDGPNNRPIAVYSAPSSSTPVAALRQDNEDDYEPTVAHAKLHQQRLLARSHNVRLPSDAEAEAMAQEKAAKQAAIKEVAIRVRFPDQSSIVATFNCADTGLSLYEHARGVIAADDQPFSIIYPSPKGPKTVPDSADTKLIQDLGFTGRMLVNFTWDNKASDDARSKSVLKPEYSSKAQELKVPQADENTEPSKVQPAAAGSHEDKGKANGGGKAKGGVPKWLKLPGKK